MTLRARIIAAGVVILLMASGVWLYLQWPRWYGTEVVLPVTVRSNSASGGYVFVEYPDAKIKMDAMRTVGVVWDTRLDLDQRVSQIRNRIFFLQLKPTAAIAEGRALWHPVSISDTPIRDAVNLRVRVINADRDGALDLEIASNRIPMTATPIPNQAAVVLKVLPSGRHALLNSLTR